ncbi:MAG: helix-turn-helix domain-containing protein [Acidimicrobiales bacterium]
MSEVERETRTVELMSRYDQGSAADRLGLVKEVVALANSGGGEIRLGVEEHGDGRPGIVVVSRAHFDAASLRDLVDRYIAPDHIEVAARFEDADRSDQHVVVIEVAPHETPPVVFSRDGKYRAEGKDVAIFQRHTVVSRRGTKAELATRADHRGWIDAAVRAERRHILQNLGLVASLPVGASLQVVRESGDVSSEPRVLLDRAVRSWRADPSKLLSRQDLLVLFLARKALTLDRLAGDLTLHRALRRRPTLWFWIDSIYPDGTRLARILIEAIGGSDRDRSDAASSIIDLSALLLSPTQHTEIVEALGSSRYKHFHDAAERGGNRQRVLARLDRLRDRKLQGESLRSSGQIELEETADELGRALLGTALSNAAANRLLGPVGFELMLRHRPALVETLTVSRAGG